MKLRFIIITVLSLYFFVRVTKKISAHCLNPETEKQPLTVRNTTTISILENEPDDENGYVNIDGKYNLDLGGL